MGTMTYDEFQQQIGKAGLKLQEFADLLKMSRSSIYNCAKTGVPSHLAVIALLVGEMAERGIDYREVLSRIDITPKKARGAGIGGFGRDKSE
jgi:hypothetical protein